MIRDGFIYFVMFVGAWTIICTLVLGTIVLLREWYIYHQVRKIDKRIEKNIDRLLKDMYHGTSN